MCKGVDYLKNNKVIAVVTVDDPGKAVNFARACADGGIKLIEVLMGSRYSPDVLREVSMIDGVLAGAGTVLDRVMAEKAVSVGAGFIVSPHTDEEIITYTKSRGIAVISGAVTSSEIVNTWKLGADMVKIFPAAETGGPRYIRALRKPLGFIDYMATGGINAENMVEYFRAGVSVVGVSSALGSGSGAVKMNNVRSNAERLTDIVGNFFRDREHKQGTDDKY